MYFTVSYKTLLFTDLPSSMTFNSLNSFGQKLNDKNQPETGDEFLSLYRTF